MAEAKAPKAHKKVTRDKKLESDEDLPIQLTKEMVVPGEEQVPNSKLPDSAEPETQLAKAGKHSAKALKQLEEKQAKEARKQAAEDPNSKTPTTKVSIKLPRSRAERAGKKYREVAKLIEKNKKYSLAEAADLAIKTSPTKFDATVEMHINLNVDLKQADHNIRETVVLPAGTGKSLKIAVIADADNVVKAQKAGADLTNSDELLQQLDKEIINFDVLITTPPMMAKLSKHARVLGPKGLMPSPKSGTVTADVGRAVNEAKAGKVEYRIDSYGIIHLGIGKSSFGAEKLIQNAEAVLASLKSAKPASLKGPFLASLYLSSTMGPSVRVDV